MCNMDREIKSKYGGAGFFPHISGQGEHRDMKFGTRKVPMRGSPCGKKEKNSSHFPLFMGPQNLPQKFGGPYLRIGGRYPHAVFAIRQGTVNSKNSVRTKIFVGAL